MSHHVTLLTRRDCALCDHAKAVLEELGYDFDLTVEEVAIDTDRGRSLATEAGVLFPPGVLLDRAPFSHGRLSARKLRRALQANPSTGTTAGSASQ